MIPGFNDSFANIEVTAKFLAGLGEDAMRLQIMPYHRMGRDKYKALNMKYSMDEVDIMGNDELEAVKNAYIERGIDCSISR